MILDLENFDNAKILIDIDNKLADEVTLEKFVTLIRLLQKMII